MSERVGGSVGRAPPKITHTRCDEVERLQGRQQRRTARIAKGWRARGGGARNCEQKELKSSKRLRSVFISEFRGVRGYTENGSRVTGSGCVCFRMQFCRPQFYIIKFIFI